jgi:ubiquinol-cytochrome c reductase cytochrome b subunit
MLVVLHLLALHEVGSNNPDGIEIKKKKGADGKPLDGIPFHPYYTVHDLVGIAVFLFVFCFILFFMPEMGGYFLEHANFEQANPLKTPPHIAPVWYYTPFYAMLRATTLEWFGLSSKLWGFMVMAGAIAIMFVLPWLDRSKVKSWRYKGMGTTVALYSFAISFLVLGYLGAIPSSGYFLSSFLHHEIFWLENNDVSQYLTVVYFLFFILMPIYTSVEKTKPEPDRVTMK